MLGGVFVRTVCCAPDRVVWQADGVPVGARVFHCVVELRADQLPVHAQPQLLMHLLLVGLSHRTAPVELRERVDFQGRLDEALRAVAARGSTAEALVLSTCNRAELY